MPLRTIHLGHAVGTKATAVGMNLLCLQGKEHWRELDMQKLGLDGGSTQALLSLTGRKASDGFSSFLLYSNN